MRPHPINGNVSLLWQPSTFTDEAQATFRAVAKQAGWLMIESPNWCFRHTIDLKTKGQVPQSLHPFGTMEFVLYGLQQGWAIEFNERFNYLEAAKQYGSLFLNADYQIWTLAALTVDSPVFVRQNEAFNRVSGQIISSQSEWETLKQTRLRQERTYIPCDETTLFLTAPPQKIVREYRVFIMDGQPVSASLYFQNDSLALRNADDEKALQHFVSKALARWMPHPTFVLDVAETEKGFFVLELNCVHCADFYACDAEKILRAYLDMVGSTEIEKGFAFRQ